MVGRGEGAKRQGKEGEARGGLSLEGSLRGQVMYYDPFTNLKTEAQRCDLAEAEVSQWHPGLCLTQNPPTPLCGVRRCGHVLRGAVEQPDTRAAWGGASLLGRGHGGPWAEAGARGLVLPWEL